jgi:hypothetical protein
VNDAELSILLLTEDTGKDAGAVVEALVRKMLGLVVPGCRLHDKVRFLPSEPREEEAMRGSCWKAEGTPAAHTQRVRLLAHIAGKLSEPDTFVVFHVDGDRPWKQRHASENAQKFERLRGVLPGFAYRRRDSGRRGRKAERSEADGGSPLLRVENLLLLCPFRSIEAWLYQNLTRAVDICRRHHGGRHAGALAEWKTKRAELDELDRPEDELCLRKEHNLELASHGFPADVAREVGKSFAESVGRMEACAELRAALERTRVGEGG